MSQNTLLSALSLSRHYGDHLAVNNVSFEVRRGEVLGFLGPNGAGKSTTMNMLSGNLSPDEGQITINGFDLFEQPDIAKAQIGYLPETPPLYKELTVAEFLQFCARLNNISRRQIKSAVDSTMERCGLTNVSRRLIGNLSKGYQQRVGIAQAIIHSPAVVILDEPTSGLDPIQIREIRSLIREVAQEHSVILSTHILPEVQTLCDRVQIISQGQLVFSDTINKLSHHIQSSSLLVELLSPPDIAALQAIHGVTEVEALSATEFRLNFKPEQDPTQALLEQAVSKHWQLRQLSPEQHSLEDVFMHIIQSEEHSQESTDA
jgi:ABC-2 type transport system ATP-binding protein